MNPTFKFENNACDQCLPFTLDIMKSNLIYVSAKDGLNRFCDSIKDCLLVGIDTETKPSFYCKRKGVIEPTSIVQIAVRESTGVEKVFILDLLRLLGSGTSDIRSLVDEGLSSLFCNPKILKLGQGLTQDLRELRESYPDIKAFHSMQSMVDTNTVHKYLVPNTKQLVSLKNFTRIYLNCNLIKKQQLSNWGSRPLSEAQITYAACDALVLLRIYDVMCLEAHDLFGIPLDIANVAVNLGVSGEAADKTNAKWRIRETQR